MVSDYIRKAGVLIEALPYIQLFRDAIVVIKFGGAAMEDAACADGALRDIVFMECVGMKPVVVHGGGKAISARLDSLGIETRFIHGLRYTCDRTIDVADQVLHEEVNPQLVGAIHRHGGRAAPVSGKEVLTAAPVSATDGAGATVSLGSVGEVTNVDTGRIHDLLARNIVPVITPIGTGPDDRKFNVNADAAACRVAEALQASKLVFLSDVPGLLRDPADPASLIRSLRLSDVEGLIADGTIAGGMLPKIRSAVSALRSGTRKVHLIDGRLQHSLLLEIFTEDGVGTQIIHD